jgi:hypothetical protein
VYEELSYLFPLHSSVCNLHHPIYIYIYIYIYIICLTPKADDTERVEASTRRVHI